ncbi:saccharopine dehydrogenase family protein [Nocardia brasiliensis]|uniref:saccharopine dehydrogenase family protein n=1 Tax=Nocardia brasiliensis TaxID=37326 RepID=UPI002453F3A0|nr:saccharopine dehydrogenase NADP-binding domain-containing protein [Nocardia brasiliensis]
MPSSVTVFGAYGHTGRFIVAELVRHGWTPILSGRDEVRLRELAGAHPGLEVRPATIDDPAALDRALADSVAVINAAGPFGDTVPAVVEAALRAGVHYVDVAAEVEVVAGTVATYQDRATAAGIVVAPAIAFYGGLGDLLAGAAMADLPAADEIELAFALDSWVPTKGTREAGAASRGRRNGQRLVYRDGAFGLRDDAAPVSERTFPAPFGKQTVVGDFTTADSVTIPYHLKTAALHTYMTAAPLRDLASGDLTPPQPADESGRSAQQFLVEVVVRSGSLRRHAVVAGRDIYAVTAPIAVEALSHITSGGRSGVRTAAQLGDPGAILRALLPAHLDRLEFDAG